MGNDSGGGFWEQWPLRLGERKKLRYIYRNVLFIAFMATILCSLVLCKPQSSNNYETKRLKSNRAFDEYNNHKILRPKRQVNGAFKNMKSIKFHINS